MRYLRMLSNSLIAGALAAAYVLILVLLLNPGLSLHPDGLAPMVASIGFFYAAHLGAIFFAALVLGQLFARETLVPGWISVVMLAWFASAAAGAGAVLIWANRRTFGLVLEPETVVAMESGAVALVVCGLLFAAVGLARRLSGRRFRLAWAVSLVVIVAASIAVPLALRGRGRTAPLEARPLDVGLDVPAWGQASRVTVLALDAASLELVTNATAEGRLPNFGRLLDAGAVLHLATLHPTSSEAVWTAAATGKLPQKNGVRSAGLYRPSRGGDALRLLPDYCFAQGVVRFGLLREEPHTSAAVRARPLWSILGAYGVSVGVLNYPLTYPPPAVRGWVISDLFAQAASSSTGSDDEATVYPPDLYAETLPIMQVSASKGDAVATVGAARTLDLRHQSPGQADRALDRVAEALMSRRPAQVTIVRYESLDPIGHFFLRYAQPSRFGNVTDEERRRFGAVLESHYSLIDDAIGRAIGGLAPEDLLLVLSGYGMEPLGLGKRLLEWMLGDPDVSGSHEAAPDGFLMAYGGPVAKTRLPGRGSVLDIVPTILYFLGLPVARDMDGSVRTDIFQRAFLEGRPITYIPSYER